MAERLRSRHRAGDAPLDGAQVGQRGAVAGYANWAETMALSPILGASVVVIAIAAIHTPRDRPTLDPLALTSDDDLIASDDG